MVSCAYVGSVCPNYFPAWNLEHRDSVHHSHSETFLIIVAEEKRNPKRVLWSQIDTQMPTLKHATCIPNSQSPQPHRGLQVLPEWARSSGKAFSKSPHDTNRYLKRDLNLERSFTLLLEKFWRVSAEYAEVKLNGSHYVGKLPGVGAPGRGPLLIWKQRNKKTVVKADIRGRSIYSAT